MERKEHWDNVFSTKQEKEVSWYQESPDTSLYFVAKLKIPKDAKIIDIGGGDMKLLDELFRWAAMGCFLETFPCKIEGGGDG